MSNDLAAADDSDDDGKETKRGEKVSRLLAESFGVSTDEIRGHYNIQRALQINVLFVGQSGSGKSTFIQQLLYPGRGVKSTKGFSTTKEPKFITCTLVDGVTPYQLNMMDTPGLRERRRSAQAGTNRKDEELIKLSMTCVTQSITTLNAIIFVSRAGYTHQQDIEIFKTLMDKFGETYSDNAMMLLTHAEAKPDARIEEYKTTLDEHPDSKDIYKYCKLGVYPSGAIDVDSLADLDDDTRKSVVKKRIKKVREMREVILKKLISTHDKGRPIDHLVEINKMKKEKEASIIKDALQKMKETTCAVM